MAIERELIVREGAHISSSQREFAPQGMLRLAAGCCENICLHFVPFMGWKRRAMEEMECYLAGVSLNMLNVLPTRGVEFP